jgi:CheY-like chemotaxis protein
MTKLHMRPRIMLAEDNPGDVFLVRRALEMHELDVDLVVVHDGQSALGLVEKGDLEESSRRPDLIMLDLNLPRATGSRVLERIRQSPRFARIPVVVVTSSDSASDRRAATLLGAAHYFQKPCDLAGFMQLGGIVRTLLEGPLGEPAIQPAI